jgi:ribulose-phosphate 3-epimerase
MLVSVSTMPAGENTLEYAKEIENFADFVHCDVCDGEYNRTTCFSTKQMADINTHSTIPLDVHLMTKNAHSFAKEYIKNGANIVTAQIESFWTVQNSSKDIEEYIEFVKSKNTLVGISVEPNTGLKYIKPYLNRLDVVLVMAVKTGSSGQQFEWGVVDKVKQLFRYRQKYGLNFKIEVDGGINAEISQKLKTAGADIVVSGSYVFGSQNKEQAINSLR